MNFSLSVLNFWLSACNSDFGFPVGLREDGYEVIAVEKNQKLESGRKIKADLVVSSRLNSHLVIVECKSGYTTKPRQFEAYASVSTADSQNIVGYQTKLYDCTVNGTKEHAESLKADLQNGQHSFPLVVFGDTTLRVDHAKFKAECLNRKLHGAQVQLETIPQRVLLNEASSLADIARRMISLLIQGVLNQHNRPTMDLEEVCEQIWGQEFWSLLSGGEDQGRLRRSVQSILWKAGNHFLGEIIAFKDGVVTFKDNYQKAEPGPESAKFLPRQRRQGEKLIALVSEHKWEKQYETIINRKKAQKKKKEPKPLDDSGQFGLIEND